MKGRGVTIDEYQSWGNYYVKPSRLAIDNVLQTRNEKGKQVAGIKPIRVTAQVNALLKKVMNKKTIGYDDVLKLTAQEQDMLYEIAKKLKVEDLMAIPSQMKTNEEKLREEFQVLRGQILNGNDSPELIKKFKVVLFKLKTNKLITSHEYNEILQMMHELGF